VKFKSRHFTFLNVTVEIGISKECSYLNVVLF